eukprot:scaffold9391_cov39-Cyclotella_meneghiniana.AAC.7
MGEPSTRRPSVTSMGDLSLSDDTMAAKVGEAGHPCEKPPFTVITVQDPSSNLTKYFVGVCSILYRVKVGGGFEVHSVVAGRVVVLVPALRES